MVLKSCGRLGNCDRIDSFVRLLGSVIKLLSSFVRLLSSVIKLLSSFVRLRSSVIKLLSSFVRLRSSFIKLLNLVVSSGFVVVAPASAWLCRAEEDSFVVSMPYCLYRSTCYNIMYLSTVQMTTRRNSMSSRWTVVEKGIRVQELSCFEEHLALNFK